MPSARRSLGQFGEQVAAAYLRRAGYCIVARNWRCSLGELDLVAQLGDQVVFVEVRTRRVGLGGAAPEESVGVTKSDRLIALAHTFLTATAIPASTPWRIDVIAVEVDRTGRVSRVEQIESAVGER